MTEETLPRRKFLLGAGIAGTAVAAGLTQQTPAEAQTSSPATPATTAAAPDAEPLLFLNETQHAFVVAAVDTMIPADELSPSGSDCGCAVYIDRQLASAWGGGAKMYRAGPYHQRQAGAGLPTAADAAPNFSSPASPPPMTGRARPTARTSTGSTPDKRVEALKAMEEGKAEFANFSAKSFFRPPARHHHGRLLLRPDLWRQSQQGVVADAGLSRPARDLRQRHR